MINVKITADNFMIGQTKIPKGSIYPCLPVVARYIAGEGTGEIMDPVESVKPISEASTLDDILDDTKPKVAPKPKRKYKTRDMKAE